jgi:large subunit ribosomal protein L35Ae
MSQISLKGVVLGYRTGQKTQKPKECILKLVNVRSSDDACRFIGRKVAWPTSKHNFKGKIVALHGRNGLVRARFRKGLPQQAIGTFVEIVG